MAASTSSLPNTVDYGFLDKLNTTWHKRSLQMFLGVVLAHWAEHLAQAVQVYILGWPRPTANGVLGLWFPWLVTSEAMHYGYALIMIVGLFLFRRGFTGTSRKWWTIALAIQFWHHIEHLVLQWQAISGSNWLGSPVPLSFLQMVFPRSRVEIHLFYNAIVFIPMVIAMYYHMVPPAGETHAGCSCALKRSSLNTVTA